MTWSSRSSPTLRSVRWSVPSAPCMAARTLGEVVRWTASPGDWTGSPPGSTLSSDTRRTDEPQNQHLREPRSMTDDPRRADEPATGETPWWARPSSDAWSAPPLPDEQRGVGWPDTPAVTADGGESGDPYARLDADTEVIAPPRDPWALTDTLGEEPRDPRRRPRTTLLVGLLAVASLLAGVAGGAVGFLLADRDDGSVTVDGSNLGSAPS